MFCTFWDVVSLAQQISTEKIDISEQMPYLFNVVKYKSQIEQFIIQVDAMIYAKLRVYYTLAELLGAVVDAHVTVPTPQRNNVGDTELLSVLLNCDSLADIYTAAWTLQFTNATTYNIYSSLEAAQGAAWVITDATKTSTNLEITIEDDFWIANLANFVAGDRLFFSVHRVHPFIQYCSCLLATAMTMTSLYVAESPNTSEFGASLWKRGMNMIHQLILGANGIPMKEIGGELLVAANLDDTRTAWDLSTIPIDYEINDIGEDVSPYLTDNSGALLFDEGDPLSG